MAKQKFEKLTKAMDMGSDEKWQVENDLRTLKEADAIMKDPKRMEKCKKLAMQEMKAMEDMSMMGGKGKGMMKG
jgi:hypothetical protein